METTHNIPVALVLLPSEKIRNLVIDISLVAFNKGECPILRGIDDRLPHISLLMGVLHPNDMALVHTTIESIAKKTSPLSLSVMTEYHDAPWGGLEIEHTKEIQQLHETCVEELAEILKGVCTLEDLAEDNSYTFDKTSGVYVNDFIKTQSGKKFWPHITTQHLSSQDISLPIPFIADTLAFCPMGDHGTCRTPIRTYSLKKV